MLGVMNCPNFDLFFWVKFCVDFQPDVVNRCSVHCLITSFFVPFGAYFQTQKSLPTLFCLHSSKDFSANCNILVALCSKVAVKARNIKMWDKSWTLLSAFFVFFLTVSTGFACSNICSVFSSMGFVSPLSKRSGPPCDGMGQGFVWSGPARAAVSGAVRERPRGTAGIPTNDGCCTPLSLSKWCANVLIPISFKLIFQMLNASSRARLSLYFSSCFHSLDCF